MLYQMIFFSLKSLHKILMSMSFLQPKCSWQSTTKTSQLRFHQQSQHSLKDDHFSHLQQSIILMQFLESVQKTSIKELLCSQL